MRINDIIILITFVFLIQLCVANKGLQKSSGDAENDFLEYLKNLVDELTSCLRVHKENPTFDLEKVKELLEELEINNSQLKFFSKEQALCGVCKLLVQKIQTNAITVELFGKAVCNVIILLTTQTFTDFCSGIIELNKPVLEYVLNNSRILDPEYACTVLLQTKSCYYDHPALQWSIDIPDTKIQIPQVHEDPDAKPIKILHLSDFHISADYEINGVTSCGYPVCCKKGLGNPIRGQNSGVWGEYDCDIPPWLYTSTLEHIKNTHKDIDWIYFTGDIIDHTVWEASYQNNSELIVFTYDMLYKEFPNTKVFSVIGNHESVPLNVFAPPYIFDHKLSQRWLYVLLANLWSRWLPQTALDTVELEGFYSVTIRNNLKIIALNNNICYIYNWWVLFDTLFLTTQLHFLRDELESAEKSGQFVHIISHVPPGNKECIEPWEKNYNELIMRYSHIIKGQFFGHTHTDELKIFYDKNNKPINMGYNGASLTPYTKFNPNYKVLTVDPNTFDILDIDTYTFNLTEANSKPATSPRWYKLYSMKEAYNLDKLSPTNFEKVIQEMDVDNNKFNQYWRYYVRDGDPSLQDGCNEKCKKDLLCQITKVESKSNIYEC